MPDSNSAPLVKRVSEMTPEERLESLQEYAEEQKYVKPGEGGTIGYGVGGMQVLAYGGPVRVVQHQYDVPIAPPSYETAVATKSKEDERDEKKRRGSFLKRVLGKKEGKGDGDVVR